MTNATGIPAGTGGFDYSVNCPPLPLVGANFGSSGPYANYVLTATVPASATRLTVDIENTSGAQIVIVRDDGAAAVGAAPVNATAFPLGGGAAVGAQGGAYLNTTHKGRLQIYSPITTPITFTGALTGATSGTLTAAWNGAWTGAGSPPQRSIYVTFSSGDVRLATFTAGSTAVTWSSPVTAAAAASAATAFVAAFGD